MTTITWRAYDRTIIVDVVDAHGVIYQAAHLFPAFGSPALFWMLIDTLSREVAHYAR